MSKTKSDFIALDTRLRFRWVGGR
eukprot:SAG22_NODE_7377_length_746_cov_2.736842_1_plen_23_part_01